MTVVQAQNAKSELLKAIAAAIAKASDAGLDDEQIKTLLMAAVEDFDACASAA